jgi:hypothetical protein
MRLVAGIGDPGRRWGAVLFRAGDYRPRLQTQKFLLPFITIL